VNVKVVQRGTVLVAQVSPDSESGLCRGFPIRRLRNFARFAGLEAGDTADLEICATMAWMPRRSGLAIGDKALTRVQSSLDPAQSGLIQPPTYYKKINPGNRVTRLLKKYK
jgi:hypothetical protein